MIFRHNAWQRSTDTGFFSWKFEELFWTLSSSVDFRFYFVSHRRRLSGIHKPLSRHLIAAPRVMATCPGNRMHWDLTADYIASETDELICKSKAVYDAVGALDSSAVTYDNVIMV